MVELLLAGSILGRTCSGFEGVEETACVGCGKDEFVLDVAVADMPVLPEVDDEEETLEEDDDDEEAVDEDDDVDDEPELASVLDVVGPLDVEVLAPWDPLSISNLAVTSS